MPGLFRELKGQSSFAGDQAGAGKPRPKQVTKEEAEEEVVPLPSQVTSAGIMKEREEAIRKRTAELLMSKDTRPANAKMDRKMSHIEGVDADLLVKMLRSDGALGARGAIPTNGGGDRFTINPMKSMAVQRFDGVIGIALIWTALATTLEIGFIPDVTPEQAPTSVLFWINSMVNLIFICDLILQFFLHYQTGSEDGGTWVGSRPAIAMNYLKGNFIIDAVSSFPFGLLAIFMKGDGMEQMSVKPSDLVLMRLFRLLRLVKLARLMRGSRLFDRYKASAGLSFAWMGLATYVLVIFIFTHWFACIMGVIGNDPGLIESYGTWITDHGGIHSPTEQYVVAFYFATMTLTTVGYGDISPVNFVEYTVVLSLMMIGGFLWAYVIGGLCTLVSQMDPDKAAFAQDFDRTNQMLQDLKLSPQMRVAVREYMYQSQQSRKRRSYRTLISDNLSRAMQKDVAQFQASVNLAKLSMFQDLSERFILSLYTKLDRTVFAPGEKLDLPQTLMIVANAGMVLKRGSVFGQGSVLGKDFILDTLELIDFGWAKAISFVEVELLSRESLDETVEAMPASDRQKLRKTAIRLAVSRKLLVMSGKGHLFKPRGMLMGMSVPGSPKPKGSQVEPEAEEVEEEAGIDLEGIEALNHIAEEQEKAATLSEDAVGALGPAVASAVNDMQATLVKAISGLDLRSTERTTRLERQLTEMRLKVEAMAEQIDRVAVDRAAAKGKTEDGAW